MKSIESIYIHIPFCISKCHYCDFFSVVCSNQNQYISDSYVQALINELSYKISEYKIKKIKTIYIGGGTPSLLSSSQMEKIFSFIKNTSILDKDYEFTIEMNPDDVTESLIDYLNHSIVNRISCGIQSLDDNVLQFVNRRAKRKENLNALEILKNKWQKKLSLDLITGLPEETKEGFLNNLNTICSFNPDHISMYSLTLEEGTKLYDRLEKNEFQYDFDYSDEMWMCAKDFLEEKGYFQYEVSNFSKKGFECKHNLTYWSHNSYLGIGCGASESLYFENGSAIRKTNDTNIDLYIKNWTSKSPSFLDNVILENVDVNTSMFEFFMMGLRTMNGVGKKQFFNHFNKPFPQSVLKLFEEWISKNLAQVVHCTEDDYYSLNSRGLLFLNKFLEELEI